MSQTPVCPRDGTPLTATPSVFGANLSAFVCGKCNGVLGGWQHTQPLFTQLGLTMESLPQLIAQGARKEGEGVKCTACAQRNLSTFTIKGVELDICEACGSTWFDGGELQRLKAPEPPAKPAAPEKPKDPSLVGVYEMWWDCEYCDTKALLGRTNRFCPNCGAQQNAAKRYFPPAGQETAANHDYDGADRLCGACNTPNGAKANNCRNCGSPMDGSAEAARVHDKAPPPPPAKPAPKKKSNGKTFAIIAGVIGVLLAFCCIASFWTKDEQLTVTSHSWERTIEIEKFGAVNDSAWCDRMPSGAYSISRKRERSGTNKIPDGETCTTRNVDRGDGTFERRQDCRPKYREEPEYADKCYFTIDRWAHARTEKAASTGLEAQWPQVQLKATGNTVGAEREGKRNEKYMLKLRGDDGKDHECTLPEAQWSRVADGLKKKIPVGVITGLPECDKL